MIEKRSLRFPGSKQYCSPVLPTQHEQWPVEKTQAEAELVAAAVVVVAPTPKTSPNCHPLRSAAAPVDAAVPVAVDDDDANAGSVDRPFATRATSDCAVVDAMAAVRSGLSTREKKEKKNTFDWSVDNLINLRGDQKLMLQLLCAEDIVHAGSED